MQGSNNMKHGRLGTFLITVQTAFLVPLWLGLLTDFLKQYPKLLLAAIIISTVLLLINTVLIIHEILKLYDTWYNLHCRRIDRLIEVTRKKLQRTIARTRNVSTMDYALMRLREISTPEIYSAIVNKLAEKERDSGKQKALLAYL